MIPINTYILSGGKSSRFGSPGDDKARALLADEPLILRLAQQLAEIATSITVVAEVEDKYADLGLTTIADLHPGMGPLAGLERALLHATERGEANPSQKPHEYLLLLSCDLVEVRPDWIETLCNDALEPSSPDAPSVPPKEVIAFADAATDQHSSNRSRIHAMPGLFHLSLLPLVQEHLARDQCGFQNLIRAATHSLLPCPTDWPTTPQINTTADWQDAHARIRP